MKQQNMFCYSRNYFKKHGQVYKIVTCKVFVTQNFFRKYKFLLFFTVGDWGNLGHVITQTRGQAFQTLGQALDFLLRLQSSAGKNLKNQAQAACLEANTRLSLLLKRILENLVCKK